MFKMRFLRSLKCSKAARNSKQSFELTKTLATRKTAPHSWNPYVATNVGHYYTIIIERL